MFRCKRQIINALETCQRHVPTLWRYRFWKFDAAFYPENILSSGVFRRETASGFYPWGKVDSPRKRVAEGLCGWRHGNSFPMTQSAQSHRQMRSIPFCSKAVFYVFCFRAPSIYPLNRKNGRHFRLGEMPPLIVLNPDFGDCQLAGVLVILPPLLLCR